MAERGMYAFTVGSPDSQVDFLHIDNLVQAHHLAGEALLSPEAPAVGWVPRRVCVWVGSHAIAAPVGWPLLSIVELYQVLLEVLF